MVIYLHSIVSPLAVASLRDKNNDILNKAIIIFLINKLSNSV